MKQSVSTFLFILIILNVNAQVGINTKNPLGIFHIDGKADNSSTSITSDQALNDFVVTSEGNVGIGSITPNNKLSVNGNFVASGLPKIGNISSTSSTLQSLYIDGSSGELLTVVPQDQKEVSVPLNYVTYNLTEGYSQTLSSFDTKISSSKYLVFIAGYTVNVAGNTAAGMGLSVLSTLQPPYSTSGTFTGLIVQTIDNGSTWSLSIRFPGSSMSGFNAGKIIWQINCLVIDKSTVQMLDNQVYDFGGSATFSAPSYPVGL